MMLRGSWHVATHEQGDPSRPMVLRTTLLPTGDVLLAVDRRWWREALWRDRQVLLAAHRTAVTAHLARNRRIAVLAGLTGAALGAGIAAMAGLALPAVMPGMALVGWVGARLAVARGLRTGLLGTLRS